jgi:hypothetical protein
MQLDFLFSLAAAVAEKNPAVYESFFAGLGAHPVLLWRTNLRLLMVDELLIQKRYWFC